MPPLQHFADQRNDLNSVLFRALPPEALRLSEVGCAMRSLGAARKVFKLDSDTLTTFAAQLALLLHHRRLLQPGGLELPVATSLAHNLSQG